MERTFTLTLADWLSLRVYRALFLFPIVLVFLMQNATVSAQCYNCPTCPAGVRDTIPPKAHCVDTLRIALDTAGHRYMSPLEIDCFSIDNCPVITIWNSQSWFTCRDIGSKLVTLFVQDESGNMATCQSRIIVADTLRAKIRNCPTDTTVRLTTAAACVAAQLRFVSPSLSNNCTSNFALRQTAGLPSGSDFPIGTNKVTFDAVDSSRNKMTCTFNVIVRDMMAPTLAPPADTLINCDKIAANGAPLSSLTGQPRIVAECSTTATAFVDQFFERSCDSAFSKKPTGYPVALRFDSAKASFCSKIIVRTFTVTDASSNASQIQQVIYVRRSDLSAAVCPPNLTLNCTSSSFNTSPDSILQNSIRLAGTGRPMLTNGAALASGGCKLSAVFTDFRSENTNGYQIRRVWTLKNDCTNASRTCEQILTVTCPPLSTPCIFGKVETENALPISVNARLTSPTAAGQFARGSQAAGAYSFLNLTRNATYQLTPTRDSDWTNGVTTYDVALLSRHILGVQALSSPYKIIAADVNRDGSVDALDMLFTRRLVLQQITSIPNSQSWRFVTRGFAFATPSAPFAVVFPEILTYQNVTDTVFNADFIAIKTGDVNGSAENLLRGLSAAPEVRGGGKSLIFNTKDQSFAAGETVEMRMSAAALGDLSGFQFTLNYDKQTLIFLNIEPLDLRDFDASNYAAFAERGKVTVSWNGSFDSKNLEPMNLFRVRFTARTDGQLGDAVRLSSDLTPAEAYSSAGAERAVFLNFDWSAAGSASDFMLFQSEPNPTAVGSTTRIRFRLPSESTTRLTLMDETGRILRVENGVFPKGENHFDVKTDPSVSGVIFYRLDTPTHSATRRMVILR